MSIQLIAFVGIIVFLVAAPSVSLADIPMEINYQGQLTDDSGTPLEGTQMMRFYLYTIDIGGSPIWNEQQDVTVENGIFNVILGAVTPFVGDEFDVASLFLEIEIFTAGPGWETLAPRQKLTSTAFAMKAGGTSAGAVTEIMLADDAVTNKKVAAGAITADKIDGGVGSGVDADMLDGLDADFFSPSVHNHDGSYYSQAHVDALEDRIAALEAKLQYLTVVAGTVNEMSGPHMMITGANLHVRSGSGSTNGTINGRGNLIVGYNELRGSGDDRTGSHNLVTGQQQNYTAYGGLVVGYSNTISRAYASVSGGVGNTASGLYASVSGGSGNQASENYSSVSGGQDNTASGDYSSVSGGANNTASFHYASVSGGYFNEASGYASSLTGGLYNTASNWYASISGGRYNTASGYFASISGGSYNTASGYSASLSGGRNNIASGDYASVSGGGGENASDGNEAFADYSAILGGRRNATGDSLSGDHTIGPQSTVSGGYNNSASGIYSSVSGGYDNSASGWYSSVSGGGSNEATNSYSSVSGGYINTASGHHSSVSGGGLNSATNSYSSVSGGSSNTASGSSSNVSGGYQRTVSGTWDWRAGAYFQDQ